VNQRLKFTYSISDAITPLDGRNKHKLTSLTRYFSEFSLDKYRILIEIKYLQKLSEYKVIRKLTEKETILINQLIKLFNENDYKKIREIELTTNHDLKAVEEFIKLKLKNSSLKDVSTMVHFGLTSDDINNIAYALMIKDCLNNVVLPELKKLKNLLGQAARKYKKIAMLGRTHGQPAAPTTIGKEFLVYYKRLINEVEIMQNLKIQAKLTGNVGNLNVHKCLYPKINWLKFSQEFIQSFGLIPDLLTTQIEPYDSLIIIFQTLIRINNLLIGLCIDFWLYIGFGYFKQKVIKSEVGSTALPHKINPIYFEGAEGGLGIANAFFEFYVRKLSYSRLQRDLSDSTVRRSFGIAFAYGLLSYQSLIEAISRIEPDKEKILQDLHQHWEILSEAIQNFLRTKGRTDAYEKTKIFFRGKKIKKFDVLKFIKSLGLEKNDEMSLLNLTPETSIGCAEELVDKFS
jgi:adenylosuccinate lyase